MRMREAVTSKTYDVWSFFYDHTFGRLVHQRQLCALGHLRLEPGDRVLDIGVGTGMTLPHYPRNVTVVGMDLSAGMLAKADQKRRELKLDHCHLIRADAMMPPFAEASFDHIMISHTISVVSDPQRLMDWASRLLKPGGRIVVLNHFQSAHKLIAWFEKVLNPLFVKVGWRSDLSLEEVLRESAVSVEYCFQLRPMDLWKIVVLRHRKPRGPGATPAIADTYAPHTSPGALAPS